MCSKPKPFLIWLLISSSAFGFLTLFCITVFELESTVRAQSADEGTHQIFVPTIRHTNINEPTMVSNAQVSWDTTLPTAAKVHSDPVGLEVMASMWGSFGTSAFNSPYLYVGRGQALDIIDFSEPSQPSLLGSVTFSGAVTSITVDGTIAYLSINDTQIHTVDISNPIQPTALDSYTLYGTLNISPFSYLYSRGDFYNRTQSINDFTVQNGIIYVSAKIGGVIVIDAQNPAQLVELGRLSVKSSFLYEIAEKTVIVGNYAYVLFQNSYESVVRIYDVSDPARAIALGRVSTYYRQRRGYDQQLIVQENSAYLSVGDNLLAIDVTKPLTPVIASEYDAFSPNIPLVLHAVDQNLAFVSQENEDSDSVTLKLLDFSDQSLPVLSFSHEFTDTQSIDTLYFTDTFLYVSSENPAPKLHIFEQYRTASARLANSLDGFGSQLHYGDGRIYDVNNTAISAYDLSGFQVPQPLGFYTKDVHSAAAVEMANGLTYVIATSMPNEENENPDVSLQIINSSNLAAPIVLGSTLLPFTPTSVSTDFPQQGANLHVTEQFLYASLPDGTIHALDISNPAAPTLINSIAGFGTIHGLARIDTLLFVAEGEAGISVVDTQNPSNLVLDSNDGMSQIAYGLAAAGNQLYVASGDSGVHVFEVSTGDQPIKTNTIQTDYSAASVTIANNLLYIAPGAVDDENLQVSVQILPVNNLVEGSSGHSIYTEQRGPLAVSQDMLYLVEPAYGLWSYNTNNLGAGNQTFDSILSFAYPVSSDVSAIAGAVVVAGQDTGLHFLKSTPTTPSPPQPSDNPFDNDRQYLFHKAEVGKCVPNAGVSYVKGRVLRNGQPYSGVGVVFSYEPDGPHIAQVQSGPYFGYYWDEGYFSHILSITGSREADWYFWIVDDAQNRISEIAYLHTDGLDSEESCQQAEINFYGEFTSFSQPTDIRLGESSSLLDLVPAGQYILNQAEVDDCELQETSSSVEGYVDVDGNALNDMLVVFSYEPDGPVIAQVATGPTDAHRDWADGYYLHTLSNIGPREGDWYFWVIDQSMKRISEIAYLHTDGSGVENGCNRATLNFSSTLSWMRLPTMFTSNLQE